MSELRAAGTIYDLGYQRYDGVRLGRGNAIRTLLGFSFRAAFGVGRGGRAKIIPFAVMALVFVPALIQVAIAAAASGFQGAGFTAISYSRQVSQTVFLLALFAAAQAPELVVTDRQQRVLSLYLSRPLGATDYALAKLGAFLLALLLLTLGPQIVLIAGTAMISETPWAALMAERTQLWPIVATATLAAAYIAVVALALAALASRRAYGTAAVMAFFLLLPAAATIGRRAVEGEMRRYVALGNPFAVLNGLASWLLGAPSTIGLSMRAGRRRLVPLEPLAGELFLYAVLITIAIALLVLLLRYRRAEV
jgi:ABC-2 type transport system permease protein